MRATNRRLLVALSGVLLWAGVAIAAPTAGATEFDLHEISSDTALPAVRTLADPDKLERVDGNTLRVRVPNTSVYCGYVTVAGAANNATGIGAMANSFGLTTAPATDWYYILARCDLDGSATLDSYYFTWSGDTRVQKLNEGR